MIETDVVIVGAGPVGLLTANVLGAHGLRVSIIERLPELIDYPRGVGMDDECLRAFQSVGLAEAVLPHTSPNHWMYFLTKSGRRFVSVEPRTDEFGWPRRNAFIQPLADGVLAEGLKRFAGCEIHFATTCETFAADADGVTVEARRADGTVQTLRARYLVGCDGGRSAVRKTLGIPFEGKTDPDRWLVTDLKNDPIGTPGVNFHCVAPRPYVSIALPHAIRRYEFMLFAGEAENDSPSPEMLRAIFTGILPNPDKAEYIRARVYTHNGRLAARFRQGRVLLAGDAAHIMPVWQGQGYNSGIRDAFNLGWKLALVLKGLAADSLLDTYEAERREHARAMIALSQTAGRIFSPTNPAVIALRDAVSYALGFVPPVKRYFAEMRFKPMARYREGALHYGAGFSPRSPVGRMFIQPRVETAGAAPVRLDDLIGPGFAVLAYGTNPAHPLSGPARALLDRLGAKLFSVTPLTQLAYESGRTNDVTVIGDSQSRLKDWFDQRAESVVLLRPDRIVALACRPAELDAQVIALGRTMSLRLAA